MDASVIGDLYCQSINTDPCSHDLCMLFNTGGTKDYLQFVYWVRVRVRGELACQRLLINMVLHALNGKGKFATETFARKLQEIDTPMKEIAIANGFTDRGLDYRKDALECRENLARAVEMFRNFQATGHRVATWQPGTSTHELEQFRDVWIRDLVEQTIRRRNSVPKTSHFFYWQPLWWTVAADVFIQFLFNHFRDRVQRCDRCGKYHINKRFCSTRCGKLLYDSANQKKRRQKELQAKLNRARDAIAKWELEEGSTDWRLYVVQHDFENHPRGTHPAGGFLTVKFLTRHVTLGDLNEPRRHRTPRLANPATTRPRAPSRKGVCTRANSPSTNN